MTSSRQRSIRRRSGVIDRGPHASLDIDSRRKKASTIERILELAGLDRPVRILEVGTGSGVIASYLADLSGAGVAVSAVDVVDLRVETDGYEFRLVEGVELPFVDATFDVVISNHVIEHVGGREDQKGHLVEVGRVLRADGKAYLATPNRWAVVEPHFRLPFLSWLPESWRSTYVRLLTDFEAYDCEPLSRRNLDALISESGLFGRHVEVDVVGVMDALEPKRTLFARTGIRVAQKLVQARPGLSPTLVYILSRHPRRP